MLLFSRLNRCFQQIVNNVLIYAVKNTFLRSIFVQIEYIQNRMRVSGLILLVIFVSGLMLSCKSHEVCPAYTKVEKTQDKF